jgi:hypothetical protein
MKRWHALLLPLVLTALWADSVESDLKRTLKPNMLLVYHQTPSHTDSIPKMITEGIWYGRLRSNVFVFDWEDEIAGKTKDHYTMGIGGSLVYKSGYLNHIGFTLAGYTSQNPWHMDDEDAVYYKVGKGVLSRYKVLTEGEYGISSLAQAYLEYNNNGTSVKLGHQTFESRMTASNDIKMIPNTFEGITVHQTLLEKYLLKAAYLTKQKLRDHTSFHHLFAYDDGEGTYDKYRQNDDTAMHQGITLSKLEEIGIDDRLIIFEADNGTKQTDTWLLNYTLVPELFSSLTLQYNYNWKTGEYTVSPGIRYMHQFDHGAGEIGGANLKSKTFGYDDPDSVESNLYGVRLDVAKDAWRVRMGMTHIGDDADIISPWRAFPTGGFGYSLLQYNWYANTTSYLLEGKYNFSKYKLSALLRYAIQDFDDEKPGVQADSNVLQLDLLKEFTTYPGLYAKMRMVNVDGEKDTIALDGTNKRNPSYKEIRFELNYLF